MSAIGGDYTPDANTVVTFAQGAEAEPYSIALLEDSTVEGMEFFQVSIATVGGPNADDGSVDTDLDTANVFILDLSSKFVMQLASVSVYDVLKQYLMLITRE